MTKNLLVLFALGAVVPAALSAVAARGADASSKPQAAKPAAAAPVAESSPELAAIRAGSQAFSEAFNKGDAKAVAALWTEKGDYVDDQGDVLVGRAAIEKAYADFFAQNPKAKIRILVDSLRMLSDSAAIEDGRTIVDPPPAGAPAIGKYLVVHVKVDGKWLMSTVRDTHVETPSTYRDVADLNWLIGDWTAEGQGATSDSTCRWVANKSFVERTYTVAKADGTKTSGVQIIGFNPEIGRVQSWMFSSDGGYAIGIWSPRAGGWAAEIRGVTGDGVPTTAVNTLTRLDDNAYVWQSVQRTMGGVPMPDSDEVVMKRSESAAH